MIRKYFIRPTRDFLLDPDAFMDRKIGQSGMRGEILLVIILGALGSLGIVYVGEMILDIQDSDVIVFDLIGNALGPILEIIVVWVVLSVALHFISGKFNGRGPIRRVLKLSAWAIVPIGIGNLLLSAAYYQIFQDLEVEEILEGGVRQPVETVLTTGAEEPLYIGALVVFLLMILWTGYLLQYAVQHAKNIDRDAALKTVALPVGAYFVYNLWTLLGLLGIVG